MPFTKEDIYSSIKKTRIVLNIEIQKKIIHIYMHTVFVCLKYTRSHFRLKLSAKQQKRYSNGLRCIFESYRGLIAMFPSKINKKKNSEISYTSIIKINFSALGISKIAVNLGRLTFPKKAISVTHTKKLHDPPRNGLVVVTSKVNSIHSNQLDFAHSLTVYRAGYFLRNGSTTKTGEIKRNAQYWLPEERV